MKTSPVLVRAVSRALGNGNVVNHDPTQANPLGQSGVHTFCGDVIDIVLGSENEADAYKRLVQFILDLNERSDHGNQD